MIVILWWYVHDWVWYKTTISKCKCKICYYFIGSNLIFQFLYINVLNYRYFQIDSSTFFKIKNVGKIKKKTLKTRFFIEKNVYKRLLQLCVHI